MGTTDKPKYISPAKIGYANLKEEILDLHSRLEGNGTNVGDMQAELQEMHEEVEALKNLDLPNINAPLLQELDDARGIYSTLDARLTAMNAYSLLTQLEKLSTNRSYTYNDEGYITEEKVTGDINTTIVYKYDDKWNVTREERYDGAGNLIGYKDYQYDNLGQIKGVAGLNADDIAIASNSLLFNELDTRLKAIEGIDFVQLAATIKGSDVAAILGSVQGLLTRVQHLEDAGLPGNPMVTVEIPNILKRLEAVENKINSQYVLYSFEVDSTNTAYDIPSEITEKCSVYLEGLLLDYGDDYAIVNGKMVFSIPLIDTFTVTCKY